VGDDVLEFEGEVWASESVGSWAFVSLPADAADEVRHSGGPPTAFGSVRVEVTLGGSTWRTSVFPDARRGTFVLPVKAAVRRAERVDVGDPVRVALRVLAD
jgi:hypothetical protein